MSLSHVDDMCHGNDMFSKLEIVTLQNGCGFFDWVDPPKSDRVKEIILGLLRRSNKLEEEHARNIYKNGLLLWFVVSC